MEQEPRGQGIEALKLATRTRTPEATTLHAWLEQVESRWQQIPELEIPKGSVQHLAIICDGNRRAAEARNLDPYLGHQVGVQVIKGVARACRQWDINHLTFWAWSTENWKRGKSQIDFVMKLAKNRLADGDLTHEFQENGVNFKHLGRKNRLPKAVATGLAKLEQATAGLTQHHLNLAIDYGGVDETARAFLKMNQAIATGELDPKTIEANPELILQFLDTGDQPNPDLVIRTGAKEEEIPHTSGFMPLQTAYACWDFRPELFPDLAPDELKSSIKNFTTYKRRLGK